MQDQVELRRGELADHPSAPASRVQSRGREPLGAGVGGELHVLERGAHRVAEPGRRSRRERQRAGQRLAPVREAGVHEVADRLPRGAAPLRRIVTSTESTCGAGWKTVRGTLRSTRTSQASCASTELAPYVRPPGSAASRSPTSRWTMATQRPALGQLLDRLEQHRRGDPVGEVRHDLRGHRLERGEVELHRVGQVEARVAERGERVRERGLERAVDLHHVQVAHARGQVLREHAEPAADLEHHVGGVELGGALDHAQQVVVDQEVLAELAVRPHVELPQAPEARLARLAHQRSTRAALASTARSSSSYETPRSPATWRAVCATLAGSFGLPRSGWGER